MKRAVVAAALLASIACGSTSRQLDDLYTSATIAQRQGRLVDALALADRGIAQTQKEPEWQWRFKLLRADVEIYENRLADARPLLAAALPADKRFDGLRARQLYLAARVKASERKLGDAVDLLQQARRLASNSADRLEIDDVDGQLHLRLGRWSEGESILNDVVARARHADDPYHEALALNDLGMGNVLRHRYDAALARFERILALETLKPFTVYPKALYNAGLCYMRLGQFDRAVAVQKRAVEAYDRRGASRDREQAMGLLGTTLIFHGSAREGIRYLATAFDVSVKSNLKDDAAVWAGNLASANIDLKDWANARRYNERARQIKGASESSDLVHNTLMDAEIAAGRGRRDEAERLFNDALAANPSPDVVWETQAGLANIALAAGRHDRANHHFEAALDTIEKTRSDLLKSDYKLSFLSQLIQFYQAYVDALVDEGQVDRALEIADASRARVLAERQGVAAPPRARAATFRDVARRSGAVLLSYWLAPTRSYLWIVTAGGVQSVPLPPADRIEALVRAHQATIAGAFGNPLSDADTAGSQLYRMLVEPAARSIPGGATVVIVPDGMLYGLNFETLPVARPDRHFWIEDVEVEVAPSLSMLAVEDDTPGAAPSLLLVGDPVPHPPEFPALAYAAAEMSDVTAHFPAGRVTRLERERASPDGYRKAQPDRFTFVHFAAHATTNVESPLDSAIILSGGDGGYKLYARDVAERPLQAELVTVSACKSAGERAYAGEGLIGFAWAFLRAGARRVVAGLWDVDDRSTSVLMDRLYAGVAAGRTPGQALRAAKLDLIHQGGSLAKPYYWAPFELFTVDLSQTAHTRKTLPTSPGHRP